MTSTFPETPDFQGPLAPVGIEGEFPNLNVVGEIPTKLSGAFIRVQPDPLFPPMLGNDIFFNGDGMISSFQFRAGEVTLNQRYVNTARLQKQREAGKSMFGLYRNPYTNAAGAQDRVYSTANTNIVRYQDRLLALKEDSLPYAMDPATLETIGVDNFEGQFTAKTFTAHPKVCPDTGNFLAFSYRARGENSTDMAYFEFDASGRKIRETWFDSPFPPFIHDFGFTPNYLVFPVIPIKYNLENGQRGGMILQWDYEQDILFGIMRRDGDGSDIRWLRLPNGFPGHVQNAFEADGNLYVDLPLANDNVFLFFPDANGRAPSPDSLHAPLCRVELDPTSDDDQASCVALTEMSVEFGRIDERWAGKPYQYGYSAGIDLTQYDFAEMGPPHPFFMNVITKIDVKNKSMSVWCPGPTDSIQEPTFIPRSCDADEGDGHLLVVVNRLKTDSSDLVVLDTRDIESGPIATIECPIRMRLGLHGNWVPAS